MKASIKLYKSDGEIDGRYPIKLVVTHKGKTKRETIGKSNEKDWDQLKSIPLPSHFDYEYLYVKIMDLKTRAGMQSFIELDDVHIGIKKLLNKRAPGGSNMFKVAEDLVRRLEDQNRDSYAFWISNCMIQWRNFSEDIDAAHVTPQFLAKFSQARKAMGNKNKTIRNYIAALSVIYSHAMIMNADLADNKPFHGAFKNLPIPRRRVRNLYLSKEGIRKLEEAKLPYHVMQRYVDLLLLQFYLGGQNLKDIYHLKSSQYVNGRMYLRRSKLGARAYDFDVLVCDKAKVLIDKYREPGEYLFPWRKDDLGYRTFRRSMNRSIELAQKRLGIEVEPKGGVLTVNVMRHTFATLAKFERIDVDIIRELMGHERSDIDTVYKDKFSEKERDESLIKVIT
ncbi:tyrosine-type recombinase/integrase [Sungkyunkwania multivorans]|uniref:Tyrosine-type recombinase/integrase n=1 Tax=Sungkyunkwania multivorans TaxID=1173618 RepID=A0ABW3D0Z5_9FLAO